MDSSDTVRQIQALLSASRLDMAAAMSEELCAREPANGIAWGLRGAVHQARGQPEQAIACYRNACRLQPDNAVLHCNTGYALQSAGHHAEAIEHYEQALRLQPGLVQVEINLGHALAELDRFDEALAHYRLAHRMAPDSDAALAGVADILEKTGAQQQALALLRPRIAVATGNIDILCLYAALAPDLDEHDAALSALEHALQKSGMTARDRARLHFRAGRLCDDLARYDAAFAHYAHGNSLIGCSYDTGQHERQTTAAIDIFSRSNLASMPVASNDSPRPIFIIGMPRTGTSLVEQILASHPEVFGGGELPWIHRMTLSLANDLDSPHSYPECCRDLTEDILERMAGRYLTSLDELAPLESRVTDKTPHNFLHLGLISRLFPRATIVHCVRNPLDTCLSCYFRLFASGNEYSYDLRALGQHYVQYRRLLRHWRDTLGIPMFEVHYEALIADQEGVSRAMLDYCGLTWNEQCLSYHRKKRQRLSPSYDDVRKPIYRRSMGRWRNYAAWLQPLIDVLGEEAGI